MAKRGTLRTKRRIPESILWLLVTVVFASLVLWGVDYYKDTDARRIRSRILDQFAAPCDLHTTLFEGKPVADLIERAGSGNEFERYLSIIHLSCVYEGHARYAKSSMQRGPGEEERRWMLRLVEDGHVSHRASVVLPPLIRALKDPSAWVRTTALVVLRDMCAAALPACSALRECLHDGDPEVRLLAIQALHHIRFETEGLVEVALDVLQHAPDPRHRELAAYTVGLLGCDARSAIPALEAMLVGGDSDLAGRAQKALEAIRFRDALRCSPGNVGHR